MFCSVISRLGSNMDRKRCLFEYQSIHSRTKDHLHVDDFNLWLINSKLMKKTLEKYRPSSTINRTSKLMVGNEKIQSAAPQKQALQGFNTVNHLWNAITSTDATLQETPELSFGNHLSTKKYSIGSVPFKNRIDRLNHDKGPDFFRSSLETQRKLKDERLSNVAKVYSRMLINLWSWSSHFLSRLPTNSAWDHCRSSQAPRSRVISKQTSQVLDLHLESQDRHLQKCMNS